MPASPRTRTSPSTTTAPSSTARSRKATQPARSRKATQPARSRKATQPARSRKAASSAPPQPLAEAGRVRQSPATADPAVGDVEEPVHHDAEDQDHDHDRHRSWHGGLVLVVGEQEADRRSVGDNTEKLPSHQAAPGKRPALLEAGH